MDPNLIHVDWERTFEALTLIIVFAFIVERVLAVVFENRLYIEHLDRDGLKETLAVALGVLVCWAWKLDALSMVVLTEETTRVGYLITGFVVAGGSKAAVKLFHDVLKVKSSTYDLRHDIQAAKAAADAQAAAADAVGAKSKAEEDAAVSKADKAEARAKRADARAGTEASKASLAAAVKAAKAAKDAIVARG